MCSVEYSGLVTRRTNKLSSPELVSIFQTHDVVLLTETWANSYCDVNVPNFEHFIYFKQDSDQEKQQTRIWWYYSVYQK